MTTLPTTALGRTGLEVSRLGYGAMELRGGPRGKDVDEATTTKLLNAVVDSGINYIDTSPDYGVSEERIGVALSGRRAEFFLATKCGCPVGDAPAGPSGRREHVFTPGNIQAAVEQSLARMKTDHLDVVQFHISPSRSTLEENDSVAALEKLQADGKVRFLGMSGTLPNITAHIAMGVFDVFQIPYSAVEREHEEVIRQAAEAGSGTVIRGGVARGVPSRSREDVERMPEMVRDRVAGRLDRFEAAKLDEILGGMSRMEFMLRFTLSHPAMHTTIVGTSSPEHLGDNVAAAERGPLPADLYTEAKARLATV